MTLFSHCNKQKEKDAKTKEWAKPHAKGEEKPGLDIKVM